MQFCKHTHAHQFKRQQKKLQNGPIDIDLALVRGSTPNEGVFLKGPGTEKPLKINISAKGRRITVIFFKY